MTVQSVTGRSSNPHTRRAAQPRPASPSKPVPAGTTGRSGGSSAPSEAEEVQEEAAASSCCIRRTGFAGSRTIFMEQRLRCGNKNRFLTVFAPGKSRRIFSKNCKPAYMKIPDFHKSDSVEIYPKDRFQSVGCATAPVFHSHLFPLSTGITC